jgi:hypothetical protein
MDEKAFGNWHFRLRQLEHDLKSCGAKARAGRRGGAS